MAKGIEKTNAIRILDKSKTKYEIHTFQDDIALSGVEVANLLHQDPSHVFKTLVTIGKSNQHYVFVIPSSCELDLKKVAKIVDEKYIEMIKSKELLPLTGHIHGGCSPIGMKKYFKTTIHESAKDFDTIYFSGGKIGYQIEMNVMDLGKVIQINFGDVVEKE